MSGEDQNSKRRNQRVKLSIGVAKVRPKAGPPNSTLRQLVAEEMVRAMRKRKEKPATKKRPPRVFMRGLFELRAGQSKLTPGQHFRRAIMREEARETPEDVQSWYAKIAGDFSKPPLVDLLEEIYLFAHSEDEHARIGGLREAIFSGNIRWLEDLTACVAFIHRLPYAGNGQARRIAGATARNIILTFITLFEKGHERPSASEIRVEMARYVCGLEAEGKPKFSDVWYLLRSGPKGDDEPGPSARYEITGIKNIKKTLKVLKIKAGAPPRGPLTVKKVKAILDKWGLGYVDDSEVVPEILK